VPPVEVNAFDVQECRDCLVDEGRKPATVNRRLVRLRAFFDWAVQNKRATSNSTVQVVHSWCIDKGHFNPANDRG
jgi:site-specific recombinase XerD